MAARLPEPAAMALRRADLQPLVNGLNAVPHRIAVGLTVHDLEVFFGVPEDLLDGIRAEIAAGAPESEAVMRFLELAAKSPLGDALSKEVKRAIRGALRQSRGRVRPSAVLAGEKQGGRGS